MDESRNFLGIPMNVQTCEFFAVTVSPRKNRLSLKLQCFKTNLKSIETSLYFINWQLFNCLLVDLFMSFKIGI
jgi:hypothetical protein